MTQAELDTEWGRIRQRLAGVALAVGAVAAIGLAWFLCRVLAAYLWVLGYIPGWMIP